LPFYVEALNTYGALGDRRRASAVGTSLGFVVLQLGEAASAVAMLEDARRGCLACGNRTDEGWALHNLGLARARLGHPDEGLIDEAIAQAIAEETSQPRLRLSCLLYRAAILVEAGRADEAVDSLEDLLAEPEIADPFRCEALALRALAFVDAGRPNEAAEAARMAIELRDQLGGMGEFVIELFVAGHLAGIPGALDQAIATFESNARRLPEEARPRFVTGVPIHARLAELLGTRSRVSTT
jgi:tetratricopeptide (TPR) repeat protein